MSLNKKSIKVEVMKVRFAGFEARITLSHIASSNRNICVCDQIPLSNATGSI